MTILTAMIKIILGMAVGFLLFKLKLLSESSNASLSKLVIMVTSPCLIFASIVDMDSSEKQSLLTLLLIGVIIYAALIPLAFLITRLLRVPDGSKGVYRCMLILGNVGFLGLPLLETLYGATGVFYMAVLNIHFNFVAYTLGIYLITKDGNADWHFSVKSLINPGTVCAILGLLIYLLGITLPEIILAPIEFIGDITSPLAMIILGSALAAYPLKNLFSNWRYYVVTAIRLIVFPVVTFFLLRLFLGESMLVTVATFYVGMPTASMVGMTALSYGGDSKTAASVTSLMNICCLATIPLMYFMVG